MCNTFHSEGIRSDTTAKKWGPVMSQPFMVCQVFVNSPRVLCTWLKSSPDLSFVWIKQMQSPQPTEAVEKGDSLTHWKLFSSRTSYQHQLQKLSHCYDFGSFSFLGDLTRSQLEQAGLRRPAAPSTPAPASIAFSWSHVPSPDSTYRKWLLHGSGSKVWSWTCSICIIWEPVRKTDS
jgi:hypothetical protein